MLELQPGANGPSGSDRENFWRQYLQEIQKGNTEALARLYDASAPVLYTLAFRIVGNAADAEEVLLDVFEQVWRTSGSFDPTRGGAWRWLTLLTRSRALDRLRSMASRRLYEHSTQSEQVEISSSETLPEEAVVLRQQQHLVRQALFALPPEQRKALELAYFSGLTHNEIANVLGVPLGTIKTRIRIAMDKLRIALCPLIATAGSSAR
ncbi:MAG: sigma-70 family RNA polymerase sigma factor [Acidobacteriaceae bacterium]|nr:sigma-70 family RNA polymerase sigma factor [Acidobacteriaceae bacterium]